MFTVLCYKVSFFFKVVLCLIQCYLQCRRQVLSRLLQASTAMMLSAPCTVTQFTDEISTICWLPNETGECTTAKGA